MAIEIQKRVEGKRGCGYRKPGGIYLVGPPTGQSCCKLPFPLTVCPCCRAGIKPARSWTWVDAGQLFEKEPLCKEMGTLPGMPFYSLKNPEDFYKNFGFIPKCPLAAPQIIGMAGLLWIGEKFYKTPDDFLQEANTMGISRRISAVPKGFEPGKTWVLLAHRKGYAIGGNLETNESDWLPAIFSVFRPGAIEYVVKGDETEEDLERLAKRGVTPGVVRNRGAYE